MQYPSALTGLRLQYGSRLGLYDRVGAEPDS